MIQGDIMGHPDPVETGFQVNERYELPQGYGDNRITLMVRDPWTFYVYWEIKRENEASVREKIDAKGLTSLKSILRVYDVTGSGRGDAPKIETDLELKDCANSWYVHVKGPEREWMVDIGLLSTNGEFFCLARSNVIKTPPTASRISMMGIGCSSRIFTRQAT